MISYRDRIAIVTGAGSGIGKALAEQMAEKGAHVIASDISSERIEKTAEIIEKAGGKVTAVTLDVSDYDAVKKVIDDTFEHHGRVDFLFNNAGIAIGGEAKDITIDDWRAVLDVNLHGVVNGVSVAYPLMCRQGFGHIVNLSSVEGLLPFPATVAYVASKYGVLGLSNSMFLEGKKFGVKVIAVCPGYIKTNIWHDSKLVNVDREKTLDALVDWVGISSEECARRIIKGMEKGKPIVPVTGFVKFAWLTYRLWPGLVRWIIVLLLNRARKKGIIQST